MTASEGFVQRIYSGRAVARLWSFVRRRKAFGAAIALGLTCGGCSFSYQLDSLWGKEQERGSVEHTGAALPRGGPAPPAVAEAPRAVVPGQKGLPPEADLVFARRAVTELLRRGAADESLPWENPKTGARGTVTSVASAYSNQDGFLCRDFLASYVRDGSESWLEGEACRVHRGQWKVQSIRPWTRS